METHGGTSGHGNLPDGDGNDLSLPDSVEGMAPSQPNKAGSLTVCGGIGCRPARIRVVLRTAAPLLNSAGAPERLSYGNTVGSPESVSGIQDSVSSSFKEFRDLLHLISFHAHFIQCFAKMTKKPIEMPVV